MERTCFKHQMRKKKVEVHADFTSKDNFTFEKHLANEGKLNTSSWFRRDPLKGGVFVYCFSKPVSTKTQLTLNAISREPRRDRSRNTPYTVNMGDHQNDPSGESLLTTGLADPAMLSKIDRLFACYVGDYIDLPQIVMVGDQSSGKSSVLEGPTGLPFPRNSDLCTRFATQIIFKRSPLKQIYAAIIPAKDSSADHAEQIRRWSRNIKILNSEAFEDVFREVHSFMGLTGKSGKTFSDDVLCLEISGPLEEHVSVIDISGIFKRTTTGITTKDDMQMVQNMVLGYMENPRSVILAVCPANVDIATQEILQMAEEVDPEGTRTLGLLTKPDLVDRGAEGHVMNLIEGRKHHLALGWHLIRNPGQLEMSEQSTNRYTLEQAFFKHKLPFNKLDKERVGIPALEIRLQEILTAHAHREFPGLSDLGSSRKTSTEQRQFLVEIASRFQELTSLATNCRYSMDAIFDQKPALKLATYIVTRSSRFSKAMETHGHTYEFQDAVTCIKELTESKTSKSDTPTEGTKNENTKKEKTKRSLGHKTREENFGPDIQGIIRENSRVLRPIKKGIIQWLATLHEESRGFELGTFDPFLLSVTMKRQSQKWDAIALGYVEDAVSRVHNLVTELVQHLCPDKRIRNGLQTALMGHLLVRYKITIAQVEFILQVERLDKPSTQDHYFNEKLEKRRHDRIYEAAKKKSRYHVPGDPNTPAVSVEDLKFTNSMSNTEHTVLDLHDILASYYKVARKRFVDTVCMQAVEYHLISGPTTPLKLFSPAFVGTLSDEQLEEIAGEDTQQKRKRKQLQKEIEDLEMGRKILA
ncbi:hypothetical protein HYALB_00006272 [Hymenoscyphus albidus]|uniref:Uncharacterized protein n=1 Tax=Hymenoscyphus albidus TaxID=595503 RepID=A0A9N9M1F7_9HELO|nr:hypothetical protein HYALB_00006272 [Hymenoscyphus albidus]